MSDIVELQADVRAAGGSGAAKTIRRQGRVPAIIYGRDREPTPITVDYLPVLKQYETGQFMSTIFSIDVDGKKERCIPREIQLDVVRDFILHVDFMRVAVDAAIDVVVPVQFINEEKSPGLKRGGILNVVRHEVELKCPANDIPDHIEVDLDGVEIGDSLHISSVKLPANATPTITDRDFTIATIAGTRATTLAEQDGSGEEGGGDEG